MASRVFQTPAIDSLAGEGILFRRAHSVTPLTLPSHTSLSSGTYPPHHGVQDNGGFTVPDELTTVAEIFSADGYDTAAFIAAFLLDSRWGLDQGFDTYVDDFDVKGQRFIWSMGGVQRPANEVVDAALEWLGRERDALFFLWVHLYDPHAPYAAPEPYRSRYPRAPYLAEIAFTDSQVARLLDGLEVNGAKQESFVVLAGDHGESLGEHGEVQHGFFIYEAATHVPLIVSTHFNLAMMYRMAGQSVEEERHLTRVLEIDPGNPRGLLFMARIYMRRGENFARPVEMVTAAVAEPLETQDLALGYFLLARSVRTDGRHGQGARVRAQGTEPSVSIVPPRSRPG